MKPTRRGWTALAVLAFSIGMSWQSGPRALNAVVAPLAIALAAAVIATVRLDPPTVRRHPVADGPVGDRRTVAIDLEYDRSVSATVRDAVGKGVAVADGGTDEYVAELTLEPGETALEYDLALRERGVHEIGPGSIAVQDALGLVERRFEGPGTTRVRVYPRPVDLRGSGTSEFRTLVETVGSRSEGADLDHEREEFAHLREYRRGDSLRDVHWKSAAKRPDDELVVTEYATGSTDDAVTVAADCAPGYCDDLAKAVASVVDFLLESELRVGLRLGEDHRRPDAGRGHRRDLLRTLATLEAADLEEGDREAAEVVVLADADGLRVVVDGRTLPFERLVGADGAVGLDLDGSSPDGGAGVETNADADTDTETDADARSGVVG
ncbi:hypothetical protein CHINAEXTREME_07010 [Halobiforma lacisalsi AJ5]|uniref:Uncharacterized protein n=1 Tax=Natronobacterium lacisalsi AJ5 TaxID=358396 RepID=M0LU55_NATLA|nr:DUF58 domain-containing protein [Halobiforma lacisalsi]APW97538.1 hypothetical protein CHINAEXTREME_07010 [Halobiforma lacisalsi AJ5]EMA37082.1 hypothetical protein C445_02541 [Halobiforma lacisalsi AJ5]